MSLEAPLRILVLASVRWYNATAAYAVELARGLQERGHEVSLVTQPGSPVEDEARSRGVPLAEGFDLTAMRPFANLRALRSLIARFEPQVVNAHRSEDHLFAALALRGSSVPLVRTRGDIRPPRTHPPNRILYRKLTRGHIACADFMPPRYYPPLGISPESVRVIRPGLDVETFRSGAPTTLEARARLKLEPEAFWIGLIGRLTAAKGHRVLLEAVAGIPAVRLLLSGTENEISVKDLLRDAKELGLEERVRFVDRGADVRILLRALDVLAVPSVASEAIPRIALEGLALGIPTVGSRLNGIPEVLGDAGILFPPGNSQALAAELRQLAGDADLRQRASAGGPERISRAYRRDEQLARTEAFFRECLHPEVRG